jgi:hypothetical protein
MGFKSGKTIHRDEISGIHVHQDVADGTHSVNELRARSDARQQAINDAAKADWPENMTSSVPEHSNPTLGNAFSRLSKPSDYVVGSKAPRFGASAEDDTDPSTQGGQPQKTAKVKGIEQPKKRG